MTGVRARSADVLEEMRNADGAEPTARREASNPQRDAKIDDAAEQYRRALEDLGDTNAKLAEARKANDRTATVELTKQLGVISERAKLAREAMQAQLSGKREQTTFESDDQPVKQPPAVKEGRQVDGNGELIDSPNGWYLDKAGNEVNGKGQRVDPDGRVLRLDGKANPIAGQYLDGDGRAVNADWKYIDDAGKLLTDAQINEQFAARDVPTNARLSNGSVVELTGADLNRGSGGTSNVWEGAVGDAAVVIKSPMGKPDPVIANLELAAARRLEALGGPKVLGTATFTRNGLEHTGVVLERVAGIDLSRVLAGEPLPFAVTEQHLRALEGFRDAASAQKRKLFDVNPGDFMLTKEGMIRPLDLAFETRAQRTVNPELDRTIAKLKNWLGDGAKIETPTQAPVSPPPPELADLVANGIARRGEAWGNNIYEGSCAHVAMRNAVSAKLAGRETYVLNVTGLSELGRWLTRFRIDPSGCHRLGGRDACIRIGREGVG